MGALGDRVGCISRGGPGFDLQPSLLQLRSLPGPSHPVGMAAARDRRTGHQEGSPLSEDAVNHVLKFRSQVMMTPNINFRFPAWRESRAVV